MKRSKFTLLIASAFLIALSGCSVKFTKYVQTVDGSAADLSNISSMKKGKACFGLFMGIIPLGRDNTLSKAAANGGITNVQFVDEEFFGAPPAWGQSCTIAYGN